MFLNVKSGAGVTPFDIKPSEEYVECKDTTRQSEKHINKIVQKSQQLVYANGHSPLDSYLYYLNRVDTNTCTTKDRYNRLMNEWIDRFGGHCRKCGKRVYQEVERGSPNKAEFHHTIPENKTANLSRLIDYNNVAAIEREIETGKIQLLCHECHQKETIEQNVIKNSDEVVRLFNECHNGMEVSRRLNMPFSTVYKCLKDNGIEIESKKYSDDVPGKVIELFNQGKTVSAIARELNIFRNTVYHILKKNGIDPSKNSAVKITSPELVQKILELGRQNVSHREIGRMLNVNYRVVGRYLRMNGVITDNKNLPPDKVQKIRELHALGLADKDIATRLDLDTRTVAKYKETKEEQ